jgi:hypothetical protein
MVSNIFSNDGNQAEITGSFYNILRW